MQGNAGTTCIDTNQYEENDMQFTNVRKYPSFYKHIIDMNQ